ncbi:MAG: hypothetical protein R3257_01290 [bacterium]|nr:hypothetical protein [bacterium]
MKTKLAYFLWSYLAVLGTALYFAKALDATYPGSYQVVSLTGMGLLLGLAFSRILKNFTGILLFNLLQGALAFVLSYFLFRMGWKASLAYPAGAVVAMGIAWVIGLGYSSRLTGLLLSAFLAAGFAIALRLQGVPGGLFFALALLNGYWLALASQESSEEKQSLWIRALFFGSLLAVGRAAIQFYLVKSNYANLGVVITHPYTYLALYAGIFVPLLAWVLRKEELLHPVVTVILLGVVFPLILGVYIHVRPMAGFLLGLVTAAFLLGLMVPKTLTHALISYLSLATVIFGLPLFKALNNLSRWIRLEILGGLLILGMIFLILAQKMGRKSV